MAIDHLSSSQIRLYLQCPQKYRYQYIDLLPKEFRSSALAFGSALHSALSWFHKSRINRVAVTPESLHQVFEADWYSQTVETDIRYKDGDDPMRLVLIGKQMLSLYFSQRHPPVKGSEIPFTVPLTSLDGKQELGINLEGFLDLVEADDTIVEFKTSAQVMSPFDIHSMLQLSAYGFAFWKLYGKPPRAFRVVNFIKNKKIRIEVTETRRDPSDLEAFFSLASQILQSIHEGIFYPRTGFWCKECEYRSLCPMWNGNHVATQSPTESG